MEKTFIMIKPDGLKRGLMGEIINRIENKGFSILEASIVKPSRDTVEKHYVEHKGKSFFNDLVDFIAKEKVLTMIVEGNNVIQILRLMIGDKDPSIALPGTIRGDYANSTQENIIHGSDSLESANREIEIWFPKKK